MFLFALTLNALPMDKIRIEKTAGTMIMIDVNNKND